MWQIVALWLWFNRQYMYSVASLIRIIHLSGHLFGNQSTFLNRKWLTYLEIQLSGQSVWERRCPDKWGSTVVTWYNLRIVIVCPIHVFINTIPLCPKKLDPTLPRVPKRNSADRQNRGKEKSNFQQVIHDMYLQDDMIDVEPVLGRNDLFLGCSYSLLMGSYAYWLYTFFS